MRAYHAIALCEMNCGTKIPARTGMKSLQLVCEKVSLRFQLSHPLASVVGGKHQAAESG
jgi:hypothetical protein